MDSPPLEKSGPDEMGDRRCAIILAAERCFVRAGFHRTTMQDVAAEAGMSPGNIYRYFQSKDELIVGIVDLHRAGMRRNFESVESAGDLLGTFLKGIVGHFRDFPVEKAILCLEVWAEATRNTTVRRLNRAFEQDVSDRINSVFARAQARGQIPPDVDTEGVALVISVLADGMFVRQALAPDYDAEHDVRLVFAVVEALLRGRMRLPETAPRRGSEE